MRERSKAILFIAAWSLALAVVWAGVAATAPVPPPAPSEVVAVSMRIDGPAWAITYERETPNNTVFRVLREASATLAFSLDWVEYGWPYNDVLVTSINGTRSDSTSGMYWQYCVNGTYATRGALHQEVHDGDTILWTYAPMGGSELCS